MGMGQLKGCSLGQVRHYCAPNFLSNLVKIQNPPREASEALREAKENATLLNQEQSELDIDWDVAKFENSPLKKHSNSPERLATLKKAFDSPDLRAWGPAAQANANHHPCADGSHVCDKGPGGVCIKNAGQAFHCACKSGWVCNSHCSASSSHIAHSCIKTSHTSAAPARPGGISRGPAEQLPIAPAPPSEAGSSVISPHTNALIAQAHHTADKNAKQKPTGKSDIFKKYGVTLKKKNGQ
jgi:hypothetical protein